MPCLTSKPPATSSDSSATVIVLFCVKPSQNPSATFTPSLLTPSATTQQRPLQVDGVKHQRRQPQLGQAARHQRLQVLAGPAHERAARGALARRAPRRLA